MKMEKREKNEIFTATTVIWEELWQAVEKPKKEKN